jgi:hypothetical protein
MEQRAAGAAAVVITGDEGGGGGGGAPEWMASLPDELKADATLSRFKSIEELAKGHVEAHKVAKSKILLPGADADDAAWGSFFDAAGRPKDPAGYTIEVPEGQSAEYAELFRPKAHELGLLPKQVEGLVKWNNEQQTAALTKLQADQAAEVAAYRAELGGEADAKLQAAKDAAKALGVDPAIANELETKLGSKSLLSLFVNLAAKMGEHGRVDGDGAIKFDGIGDPDTMLNSKMKDATWRDKAKVKGSAENAEYDRLVIAAAKQEEARRRAASGG